MCCKRCSGMIATTAFILFLLAILGTEVRAGDKSFRVAVDYGINYDSLIQLGNYDFVGDSITQEHFPCSDTGVTAVEVILVDFKNKIWQTQEVLSALRARGLRPASLPELLALGAQHPELQLKYNIVALGSIWRREPTSRDLACYLFADGDKRVLLYGGIVLGWGYTDKARWAAVKLSS